MLNPSKASPVALLNAAKNRMDRKQYKEAEELISGLLRREQNDPVAWALMGDLYSVYGKINDAFIAYARAIRSNPRELGYKQRFIETGGARPVPKYDELIEYAIVECLRDADRLHCQSMQLLWTTHVISTPAFYSAYGQAIVAMKMFDPANKDFFEKISDFKPLFTPCFLLGIRNLVIHHQLFEEFITHIRRHLLEDHKTGSKFTAGEAIALATALSHYSFNTDYILDYTETEQEKINALRTIIQTDETAAADALTISLFACYAPLYTLSSRARIAENFSASPDMASLIKMQILDYEDLCRIRGNIITITPMDSVAKEVQEQYEDFPYPRWRSFSQEDLLRGWARSGRNMEIEGPLRGKKISILIAGCGTGLQAITYATIFPDAEILAVDISRSSLAYAIKMAEHYGVKNIIFRQADLLRLDILDQKFDYIISVGVLHHLEDPVMGAKALSRLLKPDGLMRIGLYSKIARSALIKVQNIIKQKACLSDASSMKLFRRESLTMLEPPILENISKFADYYYLNMYRDLLFHAQEHTYNLAGIERMLAESELEFISFFLPSSAPAEYARQCPDDPEQADLASWHQFEEKNPTTFQNMYVFWCRRKASPT